MELQELKAKKQPGDNSRILSLVNARRTKKGEPIYALSTIRAMMNGTRTLTDDVKQAASDYYEQMDKLALNAI